ncbi:hypothetical protein CAPTEDRAFT_213350 [Capitella teleta]|uniref:Uncharacterized protein n=1 Tax=Capitella teleta TaxID=283909 RepID=R7U0V0_CAPTE|nr:hypothetical protein CAPTEDRAFT_213350 [Capitella teleta]|eukprot:ELT99639.1 hypothetical protein CAPTEDRAFT_213350 [Capitella teleta]
MATLALQVQARPQSGLECKISASCRMRVQSFSHPGAFVRIQGGDNSDCDICAESNDTSGEIYSKRNSSSLFCVFAECSPVWAPIRLQFQGTINALGLLYACHT